MLLTELNDGKLPISDNFDAVTPAAIPAVTPVVAVVG